MQSQIAGGFLVPGTEFCFIFKYNEKSLEDLKCTISLCNLTHVTLRLFCLACGEQIMVGKRGEWKLGTNVGSYCQTLDKR